MKKGIGLVTVLLVLWSCAAAPSPATDDLGSLPVTGVVQHLILPSHRSTTFISVVVGQDFSGNLPGDIDRIVAVGPHGVCPVSLKDFTYLAEAREFWAVLPGPPETGSYHLTVGAGNITGSISTALTEIRVLPPPQSLTCETGSDSLVAANRPVFAWEIDDAVGRCYSQLQIKDSSGKMVYRSGFLENASEHCPLKNLLEPDREYFYRVRIFDRSDWSTIQNRSQSNWVSLRTGPLLRYDYRPPDTADDGWETRHIQATDVDLTPLASMAESIINKNLKNIHGLLLIIDGRLVFEEYFEGYGREDLHLAASVTKSVNSLIFGQAIDRGLIKDIDQSAWDFFPEYDNRTDVEAKKKITLRHVLTMTAGLDWDYYSIPLESQEYVTRQMMASGDPIDFILSRKVVAPPGRVYNYNDGLALMLGEIVHRVSGTTVGECAAEWLFGPLGIRNFHWAMTEDGVTETHGGLSLRPRDMGKIGLLVLQDGQWNKKQIVSRQWVRAATREYIQGDGKGYGYQWRMASLARGGRDIEVVWASGYGGQRIFIVRGLNLVAVITSKVLYHPGGGAQAERLFVSNILSAVLPDDETTNRPLYTAIPPEKVVGCYQDGRGVASGCLAHDGDGFQLHIKTMNFEEICELKPVSESEFAGRSVHLGDFRIMLNWTEQGNLDRAVFKSGLTSTVMNQIN